MSLLHFLMFLSVHIIILQFCYGIPWMYDVVKSGLQTGTLASSPQLAGCAPGNGNRPCEIPCRCHFSCRLSLWMSGHRTLGSLQVRFLGAGLSAGVVVSFIWDIWEGLPVIRSWVQSKGQFLSTGMVCSSATKPPPQSLLRCWPQSPVVSRKERSKAQWL